MENDEIHPAGAKQLVVVVHAVGKARKRIIATVIGATGKAALGKCGIVVGRRNIFVATGTGLSRRILIMVSDRDSIGNAIHEHGRDRVFDNIEGSIRVGPLRGHVCNVYTIAKAGHHDDISRDAVISDPSCLRCVGCGIAFRIVLGIRERDDRKGISRAPGGDLASVERDIKDSAVRVADVHAKLRTRSHAGGIVRRRRISRLVRRGRRNFALAIGNIAGCGKGATVDADTTSASGASVIGAGHSIAATVARIDRIGAEPGPGVAGVVGTAVAIVAMRVLGASGRRRESDGKQRLGRPLGGVQTPAGASKWQKSPTQVGRAGGPGGETAGHGNHMTSHGIIECQGHIRRYDRFYAVRLYASAKGIERVRLAPAGEHAMKCRAGVTGIVDIERQSCRSNDRAGWNARRTAASKNAIESKQSLAHTGISVYENRGACSLVRSRSGTVEVGVLRAARRVVTDAVAERQGDFALAVRWVARAPGTGHRHIFAQAGAEVAGVGGADISVVAVAVVVAGRWRIKGHGEQWATGYCSVVA